MPSVFTHGIPNDSIDQVADGDEPNDMAPLVRLRRSVLDD